MRQGVVYLDTETTGFVPGQICQLSYIIEDTDGVKAKNFYFTVDKIDDGAKAVIGKDESDYKELSDGKVFWDYADEIYEDLNDRIVVAHNSKFDMNFMSIEFWRCGYVFKPAQVLCTMKYFKDIVKIPYKTNPNKFKDPKLSEVISSLSINEQAVSTMAKQLFNTTDDNLFHDSRFDTTAMWVAVVLNRIKSNTDENSELWRKRFINA